MDDRLLKAIFGEKAPEKAPSEAMKAEMLAAAKREEDAAAYANAKKASAVRANMPHAAKQWADKEAAHMALAAEHRTAAAAAKGKE